MNGKRAKALRRQAEAQTVGQPTIEYKTTNGRRRIRKGSVVPVELYTETVVLAPRCTRAAYQKLKKEA